MDKRISRIERETAETSITVEFDVDGSGLAEVNTGIGFYDHMFNAFAKHGRFNLNIEAPLNISNISRLIIILPKVVKTEIPLLVAI